MAIKSMKLGARWSQQLKKLGKVGFLIFLIKGLLWLAIPFLISWLALDNSPLQ